MSTHIRWSKFAAWGCVVIALTAVTAYSQTATFSGKITDQNSGLGIPNVAVVALGNQTGTRVAVTDAQGNYTVSMGANNNIRVRAYRTNFVFDPLQIGFVSRIDMASRIPAPAGRTALTA